ncbi:MAG: 50S ribosomal protein L29 [Chiayiivirga sp.]|nr:50S ribosomal protein L29 [Chiayiivirga sp.]
MELKQLKAKSAAELQAHLLDLAREQFSLRMQKGTGQLTQDAPDQERPARDRAGQDAAGRQQAARKVRRRT